MLILSSGLRQFESQCRLEVCRIENVLLFWVFDFHNEGQVCSRPRCGRRIRGKHATVSRAGVFLESGGGERSGMPEVTISLEGHAEELAVFGSRDQYLRQVRDAVGVKVLARHGEVRIEGDAARIEQARRIFEGLRSIYRARQTIASSDVSELIDATLGGPQSDQSGELEIREGNRAVRPRSDGQARYMKALLENELVFCIGPAGTGKTYLAVATAVSFLRRGRIKKIVLVRPAVEAGEHLGFLARRPGGQDQPLSAAAARRASRLDGLRPDPPLHGQRSDRDRSAGVHAGPHLERRGDHPGRGTECDRPSDEDVLDPDGSERADRGDG